MSCRLARQSRFDNGNSSIRRILLCFAGQLADDHVLQGNAEKKARLIAPKRSDFRPYSDERAGNDPVAALPSMA